MIPSTLEMNTDNYYNEVVINTLGIDEKGQITKLQPDYVVYIKNQSDKDIEGLEDDSLWKETKKVASEFEIPIVVVDKEKIKKSEKAKIVNMSETLNERPGIKDGLKFVKKVEHYISRYGSKDIREYKDKMNFLREYIEQRKLEEKESISVPYMYTSTVKEQSIDNRQDILRKQDKLKENNKDTKYK